MKKLLLLIIAFTGLTIVLQAQTGTPRASQRQANQKDRIKEGVQSGDLTKREAAALQGQQAKIKQDKKNAKADGVVTPQERAKIHREQKKANKAIHHEKNDGQSRRK